MALALIKVSKEMNHKQHKPYKRQTLTPKPIQVYRLPGTNIHRKRMAFLPRCPLCGDGHGIGIDDMKPGDTTLVLYQCDAGIAEVGIKLAGPIPPKLRSNYLGSQIGRWGDTAVSETTHKRASALLKRTAKRARKLNSRTKDANN